MATVTTSTVIGLFESRAAAEKAADALLAAGYPREDLSIISPDPRNRSEFPDIGPKEEVGSGADAGTGAAIGGIAGFIGGIIALAIPGIGPIIAAGPLAAGIMGAGIGAATGGVIGALKSHGVPENDAARFSEALRRGRVMIAAQVASDRVDHVADIVDKNGAIDVDEPAERVPITSGAATDTAPETSFRRLPPDAAEAIRMTPEDSLMERQRERERRVYVYPGITGGGTTPSA